MIVRRLRKLFNCPRVLKSCYNAYVLSSLEYCAPMRMFSVESHLGLLVSSILRAERLCEGELSFLKHRRKVSVLCLLYKNYHRVDNSRNKYRNHIAAACNTRASAVLGELALEIPCCRTDKFSWLFLPVAGRL